MKHLRIILIIFYFLSSSILFAQSEQGTLPTKTFSPADYGGLSQIFDIKSDSRGIIYASNNVGLLELSGITWKIYKIRNNGGVRSINISSDGKIFVGGKNEFGYFEPDSNNFGNLQYHTLSKNISIKNIGSINNIICTNNKVFFSSKKSIFIWDYDSLQRISTQTKFISLFKIKNQPITLIQNKGYYFVNDSLIIAHKVSYNKNTTLATPYNDEYTLIYNSSIGFYLTSIINNKLVYHKELKTELGKYLKNGKINDIQQVSKSLFSVATTIGIFIINEHGKIVRHITKEYGLKSNLIYKQTIDNNKILWIGSGDGLAKINILSGTEGFSLKAVSFNKRIEDIKRFDQKLYIITSSGLFRMNNPKSLNDWSNTSTGFQAVDAKKGNNKSLDLNKEIRNYCWDLELFNIPNKKLLLISTNDYVLSLNEKEELNKVAACYPYTSYQSQVDKRRVFIGLDGGVQSVYFENNNWIDEGKIPGVSEVIRDIKEDKEGNLWIASNRQGIIFIKKPYFENHKIQNPQIVRLNKGLEKGDPIRIESDGQKLIFASSYGVYHFSWTDSTFNIDSSFTKKINSSKNMIHRISRDSQNNIWTVSIDDKSKTTSVFFSKKLKNGYYNDIKVFAKKNEIVYSFYHDNNNITWFGGTYGLSKVDASKLTDSSYQYYSYLTTILNNSDTAFGGYYATKNGVSMTQPESYIKTFDYGHNSFTFYFSSSSPKDFNNLKYSWYLEGYESETNWVPWTNKTYKEYTNLDEGTYIFHVKAKDIYGNESVVATYKFIITPPWYRTIYAFIGLFILFVLFVKGAIHVSTRSLNRIIKDATVEITQQKDELETKNRNIIDSIRYAQRIQEAVIPSNREFHKYFKKSFVLWKPRDIDSGDFYWVAPKDDKIYLAAADCTGHGVPGAFMSIMGISFLNQIIGSANLGNAADILNRLRRLVISAINKEKKETENKDGMDMAFCIYDFKKMQIDYSGAYNAMYIIRNGELLETKADRMPIGVHSRDKKSFTNKLVDIQKGDRVYIFSDGYLDQFGGPKGKKFMSKRFKRLLLEIEEYSMEKQKEVLWQRFIEWRGDIEQIDDIIIIGIMVE
jgi:serine phosphatase RsbU (regulator of sigma subunit)/ligand-binding sensor domain-containing protein